MFYLDLIKGLETTFKGDFISGEPNDVIFVTNTFLPVFFARWRQLFEKIHGVKFTYKNDEPQAPPSFFNHSFISPKQPRYLWLNEVIEVKELEVFSALKTTSLVFACNEQKLEKILQKLSARKVLVVKIPTVLNISLLLQTMQKLGFKFNLNKAETLKQWSGQFATPNLDQAIQVCYYIELLSPSNNADFNTYINQFLLTEPKFFTLPNLFFSGEWLRFFALWDRVKQQFLPPFWSAFWMNAFCKAAALKAGVGSSVFCKLISKAASTAHFKQLPLERIKTGIFKLYKLDHDLKRGLSSGGLDLIWLDFI
jgi:hypothetical protein